MKNKQIAQALSGVPLNKFIAHAGVCSRRKAVELIQEGLITVNGTIIKEPGYRVQVSDAVKVKNKLLAKVEELIYVVLNKPRGYVTTVSDEQGRNTVLELVRLPKKLRIYPVGRLDINSTGVLLLTNDGEFTQRMAHPAHQVSKVYDVTVHKELTNDVVEQLKKGIRLHDGIVDVDDCYLIPNVRNSKIRIMIHSGKNRVIRRIFEHLGYIVEKLDRVNFGGVTKKGLSLGSWRMLSNSEIARLQKNMRRN